MIYFLISQLTKRLFSRDDIILIIFNGIDDIIVSHPPFYYIILFLHFTPAPTVDHIFKPFEIVRFKYFDTKTISFYQNGIKGI